MENNLNQPKISVVICTRDRADVIGQAVESVSNCDYPRFDVHVMDQSTTDATRKVVMEQVSEFKELCEIHYHFLDKAGLSRSYNAGIRVSDGELIAFTDDDCVVPANWLAEIAKAFNADPQAGLLYGQVIAPKSLYDDVMAGKIIVPTLEWSQRERLMWGGKFKVWGMGANMAIRRSLLEKVQGFDEALGGGGPLRSSQDYDFAYRTWRFGSAVLLEPNVKADHYGTRTPEQWRVTEQNYGIGDGAFYWKHVRCGDFLAFRLFAAKLLRSRARELKSLLVTGRLKKDSYGRYLSVGVKEASRFGIDKQYRLYKETNESKMTVTQANVVTGVQRESGVQE